MKKTKEYGRINCTTNGECVRQENMPRNHGHATDNLVSGCRKQEIGSKDNDNGWTNTTVFELQK